MTPQRSDSEQPRTANDNTGDSLRDGMAAAYNRGLADGRAEAGAASPSEPLRLATPQRSDSEQPRTAAGLKLRDELQDIHRAGYIGGTTWERIEPAILAIEAEAGAASPSEPLQRLHRAVAGLPVHMGHGAIRAIEVLELIEAEQRAALAAPAHERPADAALNDPRVQHILDIAKKAAEYGRATNGSGKRMTGSLEVALARLDILLQWEGEHPQAHARLAAQPSPESAEQEGTQR
jgi:hypothetical protein